ncbi:hypothetical protein PLICBS_007232 [Purpureocillium lilacinum]|uniref:uncharacterized protein n=1 Tax=Purpureocillium lilacinum TaxID=33203 RepID=UPI00208A8E34|nr:hypothetical protein PLICBS_007232 [Purpureocillium lilacinum]
MAGRNGVPRPSLDGRNRKVPATLVGKDDWPRPQLLQSREPVNLREASPPKTNPWSRTTKPTSPISNDSTLGTPDSALWPTPDNNRGPPSAKSPPPKADTEPAERCREESPASNPSSENKTSGAVLEASKAAAAALSEHGLRNGQPEDENEKRDGWQEYLKTPPSFATKHVRYWLWKTGACADVILHLDDKTYFCHREILTAESGYFRDNLPPPTSSGVPVEVALVTHGSLNSHCLRFLYTGQLEVAKPRRNQYHDIALVPMCALFFIQAVGLRSPSMAGHVIRVLEEMAKQWGDIFESTLNYCLWTDHQANTFGIHLQNTLYTTYNYADSAALAPLRIAVAGFLDAVFPVVARQDRAIGLFSSREWHLYAGRITTDMYRSRQQRESVDGHRSAQDKIKALWEQCEKQGGLRNPVPLEMVRIPSLEGNI